MFDWQLSHTVCVLLYVCYAQLFALLLVWAGLSSAHYLLRYGAVLAWLTLWLPARVNDLGWLSLGQAGIVLAICTLVRYRRRPRTDTPTNTFSLRYLFGGIVLLAGLLTIAPQLPNEVAWHRILACAVILAFLTLSSAWLALGRSLFWLRILAFIITNATAWYLWRNVGYFHDLSVYFELVFLMDQPADLIASLLTIGVSVWLLIALTTWRWSAPGTTNRLVGRTLLVIVLLPTVALNGWHYAYLVVPVAPLPVSYPEPNTFLAVEDLAKTFASNQPPYLKLSGTAACQQFTADHLEELTSIRQQLKRPGKVVIRYHEGALADAINVQSRHVARAIENQAIGESPAEQVEVGFDLLHLTETVSNGGIFVDYLIGASILSQGVKILAQAHSHLKDEERRELIARLEDFQTLREPVETIEDRDLRFMVITSGAAARSLWASERLVRHGPYAVESESIARVFRRQDAETHLLLIETALHQYRSQYGVWPATLNDLSPGILQEVPRDPFSQQPFCYRVQDEKYLLYSVGANLVDDDGIPAMEHLPDAVGDLMLNPIYPKPSVTAPSDSPKE